MAEVDTPKIAIVHDWMLLGGAEKVVEQLLEMYPDAPLYTSCMSDEWYKKLAHRTLVMGYLDWSLFRKIRKFIPFLRQHWFSTLDFSAYDIVISSSGAEAKGIRVPEGVLHINYCHAPTHYYWSRYEHYLEDPGFGPFDPLARFGLKLLLKPMRSWDYEAAQRPDFMIANSVHTAAEIKKYYGREAVVVHPPVATDRFTKRSESPRTHYLAAARQTPYKRIDLAVKAATSLSLPLLVAGSGPEHEKLVAMAGPTVSFATNVSDARWVRYFQEAKGFLFPGIDDFGITPVEAMAAGVPVLAYKGGGALDYVTQGKTGLFFTEQTEESLKKCLQEAEKKKWSESIITKKAAQFAPEKFRKKMKKIIEDAYTEKLGNLVEEVPASE